MGNPYKIPGLDPVGANLLNSSLLITLDLLKLIISNELLSKLAPTGSRPGILYGLPKVHKPNIPLRPIVSSINSHSFNIAKFLVPLLRPISVSQYSINDTFSLLQELFEQKFNNNVVKASFDITSLFTNVPLDETIKIIADQLFSNSNNFEGFSRDEFVKLLNLVVILTAISRHKTAISFSMENFMTKLMGLPWGHLLDLYLLIFFFLFMRLIGLKIVLSNSNLYTIGAMLMIRSFLNHVTIFYHFLITLILSILISLSHMRLKKINVFLFLM